MYNFYFIKNLFIEWLQQEVFLNPLHKSMNNSSDEAFIQDFQNFLQSYPILDLVFFDVPIPLFQIQFIIMQIYREGASSCSIRGFLIIVFRLFEMIDLHLDPEKTVLIPVS